MGSTKWSFPSQLSNIRLLRKPVHHAVVDLMPMRRNTMGYYGIHALLHVLFYRLFILKASQALMSSIGMPLPNCIIFSMLNDRFIPSSYVPYPVCNMKNVFLSLADTSENTVISNLCRNQGNRFNNCVIYWYIQGVPGGMDKTSGECSLC